MVVEYGPVVTGLDATALQFYDSGILDDMSCCDAADNFDCVYVFYTIFKNSFRFRNLLENKEK